MRIYIDSSIPSFLVARPCRDRIQTARQELTRAWWERLQCDHELFASQLVLDEISAGNVAMARLRMEAMAGIPLLNIGPEVEEFTRRLLESGVVPAGSEHDAAHIGIATHYRMDLLLTWNCRHIANKAIQERLRRLADRSNLKLPILCTLEDLAGGSDE